MLALIPITIDWPHGSTFQWSKIAVSYWVEGSLQLGLVANTYHVTTKWQQSALCARDQVKTPEQPALALYIHDMLSAISLCDFITELPCPLAATGKDILNLNINWNGKCICFFKRKSLIVLWQYPHIFQTGVNPAMITRNHELPL